MNEWMNEVERNERRKKEIKWMNELMNDLMGGLKIK